MKHKTDTISSSNQWHANVSRFTFHVPRKGFTLIELLIVVVVIALFTTVSLAYYNRLSAENALLEAASKTANVLELAKKKASAAEGAGSCATSFDGYQVTMANSRNYRLVKCCDGSCTATAAQYSTPLGVLVSSSTPASILFKPLSQPITAGTITLRSIEITRCISISVTSAGAISMGDKVAC